MSSHSDPTGALVLGTIVGTVLFFRGFRKFREYKIVEDTPRIPIRSAPMGLVHVRGKAQSDSLIASPISRTQCCFYQVRIERWKSDSHGGNWENYRTASGGTKFHLQDDTGRILVDSYSAELDLVGSPPRIVDHGRFGSDAGSGASDQELLQFVEQSGVTQFADRAEHWLLKKGPLDDPRREQGRQALLEMMHSLPEAARGGGVVPVDALQKLMEAPGPLADPEKEQKRQMMLDHLRQWKGQAIPLPERPLGMASGRYRLREYLILPGEEYNITGTCVENTGAESGADRCMIAQGRNEKTFLISCRTDAEAQGSLRKSSFGMVFGGAALTLICLALLLAHLGLF
jgi:hypothetical protein